jgi:membrane-associated phospholipid phosphatase
MVFDSIAGMKCFYQKLFAALVVCCFFHPVAAQQPVDSVAPVRDSTPVYYRINKNYLKSYWTEFKGVATAPAHWKGRDWATFAAITGSAGIMMLAGDKPVQEFLQRNQYEALHSASKVFYPLGNRLPPALITSMYVVGVVTKNRKLEHLSLSVAKSLAISTVFYVATKSAIRRLRPDKTDNPRQFAAPFTQPIYSSFPSGHSNTAFAVATAFAMEYPDKKWVHWVAYSLATLTALDRMYQNRHWTSDVIIGASIGHFVTKKIYKLQNQRRVLSTGF